MSRKTRELEARIVELSDREITYLVRQLNFFMLPGDSRYDAMKQRITKKLQNARTYAELIGGEE